MAHLLWPPPLQMTSTNFTGLTKLPVIEAPTSGASQQFYIVQKRTPGERDFP
jgi:hypothetical protein